MELKRRLSLLALLFLLVAAGGTAVFFAVHAVSTTKTSSATQIADNAEGDGTTGEEATSVERDGVRNPNHSRVSPRNDARFANAASDDSPTGQTKVPANGRDGSSPATNTVSEEGDKQSYQPGDPNQGEDDGRRRQLVVPANLPLEQIRIVKRAGSWDSGQPLGGREILEQDEYLAFRPEKKKHLGFLHEFPEASVGTLDLGALAGLAFADLDTAIKHSAKLLRLDLPARVNLGSSDLLELARLDCLEALNILFDDDQRQLVANKVLEAILGLKVLQALWIGIVADASNLAIWRQGVSSSALAEISITATSLSFDWIEAASLAPRLERLALIGYAGPQSDGGPVGTDLSRLSSCQNLHSLRIIPALNDEFLVVGFPKLPKLESLELRGTIYCVSDIVKCDQLRILSLGTDSSRVWFDSEAMVAAGNRPSPFRLISELTRLETLRVVGRWSTDHIEDLSPLARLGRLASLTIGGDGLAETIILQLASFASLRTLCFEQASVAGNKLDVLSELTELKELGFDRCSDVDGQFIVDELSGTPSLEMVWFAGALPAKEVEYVRQALTEREKPCRVHVE